MGCPAPWHILLYGVPCPMVTLPMDALLCSVSCPMGHPAQGRSTPWATLPHGAPCPTDGCCPQVWQSRWKYVTTVTAPTRSTTPQPLTGPTPWPSNMLTRRCHAGEDHHPGVGWDTPATARGVPAPC